ncbi:MAG: hypothetical protein JWO03_1951 [Bacteroidetes bacterium]|nr:hypothetical protein [Bacteroidota bacterium]
MNKIFVLFTCLLSLSPIFAQNVGIGETAPASKLSVKGSLSVGAGYSTTAAPTNGSIIQGSVGVGTNNPLTPLEVSGAVTDLLKLTSTTGGAGNKAYIDFETFSGAGVNGRIGAVDMNSNNGSLVFETGNAGTLSPVTIERMRILNNGNVGIGTITPTYTLDVNAGTSAFRVTTTGGSTASGGTTTISGAYTIVTFTSSGTFTPGGSGNIDVLVVGGGGGGGARHGGGGGGGGVVYSTNLAVTNQTYTVTVGAGGLPGVYSGTNTGAGGNGGNSSFPGVTTAIGGGGGRTYDCCGGTGGSGGGGAGLSNTAGLAGTAGQGNSGGNGGTNPSGGGGGGAGGAGANVSGSSNGGAGGVGISNSITGSAVFYGGGGGGGGEVGFLGGAGGNGGGGHGGDNGTSTNQAAGTNGLGGGGGGDRRNASEVGSAGGSGVVIIRYLTATGFSNTSPAIATGANNNIGIGVAPASADMLEVGGIVRSVGYRCRPGISGAYNNINVYNFEWNGSIATLWIDGVNCGTLSGTSDRRLKENIGLMGGDAIARVMALKPVHYNYKKLDDTLFSGSQIVHEGFIADELQEVIPSAVNGKKDAVTATGVIQPQTINMAPIVSVLTKAIQEQQTEIEQLKAENTSLRSENSKVKATNEELTKTTNGLKVQVDLINERLNIKSEK